MPDTPLADFLRARRALARPEDHGMPAPGPRRTPGLRREEVAMLAGVSTDYYIRLEQGRERHPSPQVVEALAAALSLDVDALAYLRELAEPALSRPRSREPELAGPALVQLMDGWSTTPALTLGRYLDILAANPLGEALFAWMGEESSLVEAVFLNPAARHFYRDWPAVAAGTVAALRANAGADLDDPRMTELVGRLGLHSAAFAELWPARRTRKDSGGQRLPSSCGGQSEPRLRELHRQQCARPAADHLSRQGRQPGRARPGPARQLRRRPGRPRTAKPHLSLLRQLDHGTVLTGRCVGRE